MQLYANVRPARGFAKTQSYLRNLAEGDIDWILVQEILKVNIVVKEGDLISTSHESQQQRLPSLPESALNASCGLHLRLLKVDHGSFFQ
jgi:isocitrate/isopropylmalate dehydrogenase